MPDALTTLTSVCLSSLLSGTSIWLTKSWISERLKNVIEHEYNEKLETHKAQLRSESDIAIERLKSLLQIAASERNVRYSRVFERTAESVAQIYAKLLAFLDAVEHYTTTIE